MKEITKLRLKLFWCIVRMSYEIAYLITTLIVLLVFVWALLFGFSFHANPKEGADIHINGTNHIKIKTNGQ